MSFFSRAFASLVFRRTRNQRRNVTSDIASFAAPSLFLFPRRIKLPGKFNYFVITEGSLYIAKLRPLRAEFDEHWLAVAAKRRDEEHLDYNSANKLDFAASIE